MPSMSWAILSSRASSAVPCRPAGDAPQTGMHPKRGCPSSLESGIRARDFAGLSRENFTAYREKQWFWCLKFGVLLVKDGRMVSAHPGHRAGGERKKSEQPKGTATSTATAEKRAVVMTSVHGFSSFSLTASKNP